MMTSMMVSMMAAPQQHEPAALLQHVIRSIQQYASSIIAASLASIVAWWLRL